jgi:hypothetical protein
MTLPFVAGYDEWLAHRRGIVDEQQAETAT